MSEKQQSDNGEAPKAVNSSGSELAVYVAIAGVLVFLAGPAVFAFQCVIWLRDGYWTPLPLYRFVQADEFVAGLEWRGLARIVWWLLDTSLSVALIIAGMLTVALTIAFGRKN